MNSFRNQFILVPISLLALLITSCGATPPVRNILSINKFGDPVYPGTNSVLNETQARHHFNDLLTFEENEMVLYIHGGLNTPIAADKRAMRLVDRMKDNGVHPVFVHWRSGLLTTYLEHTLHHRQGEYWPFILSGFVTSPFIVLSDIGRSIARTPIYWFYKFNTASKAAFPFEYPSEKNAQQFGKSVDVAGNAGFAELPVLVDSRGSFRKTGDSILNYGQFGISLATAPLFDLFGTSAWGIMKRRAGLLFVKTQPLDGEPHENLLHYEEKRKGALTRFLHNLSLRQQSNPNLKITLVGHSMGAIVSNQILRDWPNLKPTFRMS